MARSKAYYAVRSVFRKFYRFTTLRVVFPNMYRIAARKKIDDNKAVFIEVRAEGISDDFALMYDKLKKEGKWKLSVHHLRMGFVNKIKYFKYSREMVKDIADAKYVFLSDSSDVFACLPLRKKTVVAQMWHGCGAFKKFGMSTADLLFGENRKTLEKYPFHGNYSMVTVSSPEVKWAYEEAMSLKKGVAVATGLSRTDVFFDESKKTAAREKLYKEFPEAKGKKVILYAPTFRGHIINAKSPDVLSLPLMNHLLKDEYVLIYKHHPFVKKPPVVEDRYAKFAKDMTQTMTIEDLIMTADICISDYSSLIFEYSLMEKPMIFLAHDIDNYCDWRGFYYDFKEMVPGPIVSSTEEIIDFIQNIDEKFDLQKVKDFREKFMSACDGHCTEKIWNMMLEKGKK